MEKFRGIYRNESTRLQKWDYGWRGKYHITMCTKGREFYFGKVVDGKMILSEIGRIAKSEWLRTIEIRPDMNIVLDEFIVMSNHIHGIIEIGKNEYNSSKNDIIGTGSCWDCWDTMHGVPTALTINSSLQKNKFGPQKKNIASIIRGVKSAVTMKARQINPDFSWQSGFHDQQYSENKESI